MAKDTSMSAEQRRSYTLAKALLTLAKQYEGDTGSWEPLGEVRTYLATFTIGRTILKEEEEGTLDHGELFPKRGEK